MTRRLREAKTGYSDAVPSTVAEQRTWLFARGWRHEPNSRFPLWSWREPRAKAMYTFHDALALERSRHPRKS